ncbi:MAG: hypothetical protein J6Z43_01880 [Clostridiales bacterium]|nr:hypothetical protein [Clostridiales bacterium]
MINQNDSQNERDIDSYLSDAGGRFTATVVGFIGSSLRATKRFFKSLPWRLKSIVFRKINEYKNRPERKDPRKVYVLVGYTTKESVDAKYNAERRMILMRRGLLAIILLLLIFISVDRLINMADFGEISHIFGVNSIEDITENDPFKSKDDTPVTIETVGTSAVTSSVDSLSQ